MFTKLNCICDLILSVTTQISEPWIRIEMLIDWLRDSFSIQLSSLFTTSDHSIRMTADNTPICQIIAHFFIPLLVNKTLRDLNILYLRQQLIPHLKRQSTLFQLRPMAQIWRCWFLSQPLYTRLQTYPGHTGYYRSMRPTELHHLQKCYFQSTFHWSPLYAFSKFKKHM